MPATLEDYGLMRYPTAFCVRLGPDSYWYVFPRRSGIDEPVMNSPWPSNWSPGRVRATEHRLEFRDV